MDKIQVVINGAVNGQAFGIERREMDFPPPPTIQIGHKRFELEAMRFEATKTTAYYRELGRNEVSQKDE